MKKPLAILLTLSLIISVLIVPVSVSADTTETVYYYNDFSNALEITNANTNTENPDNYACHAELASSDDGQTVAKFYNTSENSRSPKWTLDDAPVTPGEEVDLVLEFRTRICNPNMSGAFDGYFSTWGAGSSSAHTSSERTIALYNRKYQNGIRWTGLATDTTVIDGIEIDEEEWNTFSIVYSATNTYRELYVNGVYAGKSAETADDNRYATSGKLNPVFIASLLPDEWVEMDYLKIYKLPTDDFTASLKDAYDSSVVIEFNQIPGNIDKSMFTLNDGTKIKEVVKTTENMYKLVPETELTVNTSYTLTISDTLKSTLGKTIGTSTLTLTPKSSVYVSEGTLPYFNTFSTDGVIDSTNQLGSATTNLSAIVENGYLNMSVTGTASSDRKDGSIYFEPTYENTSESKQPLVLEYKVKFDDKSTHSTNHFFEHFANTAGSSTWTYGMKFWPKSGSSGAYYPYIEYTNNDSSKVKVSGEITDWHTISIVYSSTDNTKELYWDGESIGKSTPTDAVAENYWDDSGKLGKVRFYLYSYGARTMRTYMDYLKVYEKPETFGAQVLGATETEFDVIYVDFNSTVSNIDAAGVLTVNGKAPLSIEEYNEEDQIYKVTLSEKLKPSAEYKLSLNGVANTVGQMAYNDLSFTTRAPKDNEALFDISGEGTVKDSDGIIKNGDFKEKESIALTVKPNKGYTAVVKVNNEEVSEASYGLYNITVTDGAVIDIDFTAIASDVEPSFSTPFKFVDKNEPDTSYTFVRLNMALPTTDFGVIVSKYDDKLTAEGVEEGLAYMLPATNGSNAFGEYGISIKDKAEGNKLGNKYYVRPYAKLGDTYYYQTPVTIEVETVQ